MEFSGVIIIFLFLATVGLFAYCLTEPRGKNTVHARKQQNKPTQINEVKSSENVDTISQSYNESYDLKNRKTEAA